MIMNPNTIGGSMMYNTTNFHRGGHSDLLTVTLQKGGVTE